MSDRLCTVTVGGTAIVRLHGEFDLAIAEVLREGLGDAVGPGPDRLVIDLADTAFVDCSAMHEIARACRTAPRGCQVVLRSPSPLARRVIELCEMDRSCLVEP